MSEALARFGHPPVGVPLAAVPRLEPVALLRPSVAAPTLARTRLTVLCSAHRLREQLVRNAAFVTGELVGISVRQARAPLAIYLIVGPESIVVRVVEHSVAQGPQRLPDAVAAERSLQLVKCVARSCGIDVTADGRQLWACFGRHR